MRLRLRLSLSSLLVASPFLILGASPSPAMAQSGQLSSIEKQIQALQAELRRMRAEIAQRNRALKAAQQNAYQPPPAPIAPLPPAPQIPAGYALMPAPGQPGGPLQLVKVEQPPALPKGTFQLGGVNVQLGGFFEAAGYYRSRLQPDDLVSSFNSAIPLRNSPLYHESQSGITARQTRLLSNITADPDEVTHLVGNVTIDFLGGAPTANYNESNSWTPRLREAWIEYERKDLGFFAMGGQTWSLATMNSKGVDPSMVNVPPQIDPQYIPGFVWTRQAGFRIAKSFGGDQFWLAASVENAQTLVSGTAPTIPGTTINQSNPGVGVNANTTVPSVSTTTTTILVNGKPTTVVSAVSATGAPLYTNNFAPDAIVKATADFDLLHAEAFGLGRVFNNRTYQLGSGQNNTVFGGGVGGGVIVHVIPKVLDIQASGLWGYGVERYSSSQLADQTYNYQGHPAPLPGYSALAGVIAHPDKNNDFYAFFGVDHVSASYDLRRTAGVLKTVAGYGSPLVNNETCNTEGETAIGGVTIACSPFSSGDAQITVGNWWKFIQGPYGKMQIGAQYSYTRRFILQGIGQTPKTDENAVFLSFRWYPFS